MILNARAENGASSLVGRVSGSSLSILWPLTSGTSIGDGRKSITASSSGCTPLFLKAEPHSTGTKTAPIVPFRMHFFKVARSGSWPPR